MLTYVEESYFGSRLQTTKYLERTSTWGTSDSLTLVDKSYKYHHALNELSDFSNSNPARASNYEQKIFSSTLYLTLTRALRARRARPPEVPEKAPLVAPLVIFNSIQLIKFRNTIIHEHTLLYKDLLSVTGYHL